MFNLLKKIMCKDFLSFAHDYIKRFFRESFEKVTVLKEYMVYSPLLIRVTRLSL